MSATKPGSSGARLRGIARTGRVVGFSDPQQPLVLFESTRCDNCRCGRRYFGSNDSSLEMQIPADIDGISALAIGQQVTLYVGAQRFSQATLLLFGLPVLLAFSGCGLAWVVEASVGLQAFGAAAGGFLGWFLARTLSGRMQTMVYESLSIDSANC